LFPEHVRFGQIALSTASTDGQYPSFRLQIDCKADRTLFRLFFREAGMQKQMKQNRRDRVCAPTIAVLHHGRMPITLARPSDTLGSAGNTAFSRLLDAFPSSMPKTADAVRLLVIDDEPDMRAVLSDYFQRHGFVIEQARDALQARDLLSSASCALAIVDVNLPGENGLALVRWMREAHPGMAVVLLTANSETVDRVVGLEIGADDYVSKPCELRELLARVRAVLRRAKPTLPASPDRKLASAAPEPNASADRIQIGTRVLDLKERKLLDADSSEIEITAAEFDLLALLAQNPNRPLTRDHIMEQAHGRGWDVFDRSIDLRIMRLRRKIERNPDKPEIIKTVRNVGYVFVMPLA
jgi:DNA-binding response OmpR family regulator